MTFTEKYILLAMILNTGYDDVSKYEQLEFQRLAIINNSASEADEKINSYVNASLNNSLFYFRFITSLQ